MKKKELLMKLKSMGYPLFETEEYSDVNETLAEVVKSRDPRLWEGFPLLLADTLEKNLYDAKKVEAHFRNARDRAYFRRLALMSLALYEYLELKLRWRDSLKKSKLFDKKLFDKFFKQFKDNEDLPKEVRNLSSARIVNTFKRYFKEELPDLNEYTRMKDEFDLEYALSQVFSKKQKELFLKKLKSEKMTKTEREYYSRSVKKKVLALANPDLHKLAVKLAGR